MADQLQLRGGTTTEHNTFTGASKEVTVDTTKKTAVVHDGATAGGNPLMREDGANSALALGSQGTPSLKFTGDTNTGIYSPGADQVAISTGGTGRLFVDASGNVAVSGGGQITSRNVGASPGKGLIQLGDSGAWQIEGLDSGYGGSGAYLKILSGANERLRITSTGALNFVGAGTAGSSQAVSFNGSAPINSLVINSTGKVGLGTASPSSVLHVANSQSGVGGAFIDARTNGTGEGLLISANTRTSADDATALLRVINRSGADAFRVNVAGNVGLGTSTPDSYNANGDNLVVYDAGNSGITVATGSSTGYSSIYLADGTAGGAQYSGYIQYYHSTDKLYIGSGAGNTITCDSDQRVGINNTSPEIYYNEADNLVVGSTGSNGITIVSGSTGNGRLHFADGTGTNSYRGYLTYNHTSDLMAIGTAGQSALNIDSSQRLLVGTSTPIGNSYWNNGQIQLANDNGAVIQAYTFDNGSTNGAAIELHKARGTQAAPLNPGSTDILGEINFYGYNSSAGTPFQRAAYINCRVDGTPGQTSSDMPGELNFATSEDGSATPTVRLHINNLGQVGVGSSTFSSDMYNFRFKSAGSVQLGSAFTVGKSGSDYDGAGYNVAWQSTGTYKYLVSDTAAFIKYGGSGGRIETFTAAAGTGGNAISFTTGPYVAQGGTSWTSSSDERLKEDLLPIEDGLAKVGGLRAVTGRFKTDDVSKRRSFLIAQDVQTVLPEAVDTVEPEALGLDYVAVIPLLVAALKESKQRIETLEQRLSDAGIA